MSRERFSLATCLANRIAILLKKKASKNIIHLIFPLPFDILTFTIVVDAISALSGGVLV